MDQEQTKGRRKDVPRKKRSGPCSHHKRICRKCLRPIKYNEAINKNAVKVGKDLVHTRCLRKDQKFEPLSRLEKQWVRLRSEFVQCNQCRMILDKENSVIHILKCQRTMIEIEGNREQLLTLKKSSSAMTEASTPVADTTSNSILC